MQKPYPTCRKNRENEPDPVNGANLRTQGFRAVLKNPRAQQAENQGKKIRRVAKSVQEEICEPGAKAPTEIANRASITGGSPAWVRR